MCRHVGLGLISVFAGGFIILGAAYIALAATTTLLPGDIAYLGVDESALCRKTGCQMVDFITHNRAAYGGSMMAGGMVAAWIVAGPLRNAEPWAWWALLIGGAIECGCSIGFIAYGHSQSYGFGPWHVAAIGVVTSTLALGLLLSRSVLHQVSGPIAAFRAPAPYPAGASENRARLLLVALAAGFVASGLGVLLVAMTTVFVPQDIAFLNLDPEQIAGVSDRLLPLVAHDRAEFGAGMMTLGVFVAAAAWKGVGVYGVTLWLTIAGAGGIHFLAVIASHLSVGYTDFMHLAPVYGATALLVLALRTWRPRASLVASLSA